MTFSDIFGQIFAGFFGQIFGQIFDQIFGQVFDQGFLAPKYSVQYYWDGQIQCTVLPGQRKHTIYYLLFEIPKLLSCILGTVKYYLKIARGSLFIE